MNDSELNSNQSDPKAETAQKTPYNGQPDDLHNLIIPEDTDPEDPLAALRNNPDYSALIAELEFIAREARRLFEPAEETPSDDLWDKIKKQLPNETTE